MYICSEENKSEHKPELHADGKCDIKSQICAVKEDATI
jgi:hypothetical protein